MAGQVKAVRQIRIALLNLERFDPEPTLWGRTNEERWGALDDACTLHTFSSRIFLCLLL
jgi:hypothetical protein